MCKMIIDNLQDYTSIITDYIIIFMQISLVLLITVIFALFTWYMSYLMILHKIGLFRDIYKFIFEKKEKKKKVVVDPLHYRKIHFAKKKRKKSRKDSG